ncbi:MAG: CoA transferase [Firmicutes bacterium]|nr:CoA transferase [Bacillota bacterium]
MPLPLEGIRVTDLAVVWSGPMAATLLADLGAEVIHLENLRHPPTLTRGVLLRPTREQSLLLGPLGSGYPDHEPGQRPWNRTAMFNAHGRNKRCATVDLTQASGHEIFLRLIEKSDVFIENNARTTLEHLGLDATVLFEVNPRLILLRMPPLGLEGPFAAYRGFGPTFNSLAGVTAMGGYHDADLTSQGDNYHMDEAAAPAAAFAVMAGLWRREQSGTGQLIEFPQVENLIQQLGEYLIAFQLTAEEPPLYGNRDPYLVQGVYPCPGSDRWIAISLRDDADWAALKRAMGAPAWAEMEIFSTHLLRMHNQNALDERIAAWTSTL